MSSMFHIGTIPMVQSSQGFVTADDASGVNTGIRVTIVDPDISLTDFSVSDDRFELVADGSQRAFLKLKVGQSLCEETSVNIIYNYAFHTDEGTTGYIEMPLSFTISMYTDGDFIHGYSGDDTLNGGAGDDKMYGVEGDDTLSGGAGDDNIIGGLGDDTIYGGVGDDRLDGDGTTYDISEGGDDTLSGWRGDDHLYGGDGDDILYSGDGDDRLYGNAGDDTLYGGEGDDWLIGALGDDTLYGGAGKDWLLGGVGADIFVLGTGGDTVVDFNPSHIPVNLGGISFSGDGDKIRIDSFTGTMPATVESLLTATNLRVVKGHISVGDVTYSTADDATTENTAIYRGNTLLMVLEDFDDDLTLDMFDLPNATTNIIGTPGDDTLNGGGDDDTIRGTPGDDTLNGGSDDDTIRGRGGDDTIDGGDGDDDIRGGSGDDTIDGGSGDDEIRGRGGDDTIDGGSGDDELRGNRGDDAISGSGGDDDLHGGKGDDTIYGDEGNDILRGKAGDDTLYGGRGDDTFYGKAGDDTLYGGAGDDELRGGKGDDILDGGSGDDTLSGGKGADIFVLNTDATGTDTITDFNANDGDKIRVETFTGTMPATVGDLLTAANLRVVKGHISVDGLNSTTDKASKQNTAIYKGDTLLMVLEDFDANLTLDMFDLPNATPIPINNAPTFAQETYTATIARGAESGDIITNIAATDPEGDTLTYSITAGNDAGLFIVDATNGDIKLATPDTRTDAGDHTLTLTVTDSAGNTATATVTITDYAIRGTDGDDLHTANGLYGDDEGDDTIYGNAGDDHIRGGAGDDTLYGGAGDDRVFGDGGDDTIYGGAGDDHIFAEGGNDTLYGGRGDDYVSGGDGGTNLLYGGAGADLFEVGVRFVGTDIVVDFNAEDDDHLELFIYADGNFDASSLEALLASGGFRLDTSGNKIIEGYESGENDADIHDTVIYYEGHKGETVIAVLEDFTDLTYDMFNLKIYDFGDDDNTIRGTAEVSNHISGGHGDDTLYGGSGEDRLNGGFGDDHIYGGAGYDRIQGSVGDDTLYGGDGDDRFWGSTGDDILYGGADNDWLYGGDGDDTLYGGDGDDILVGDAYGRDGGADIFALNADDAGVDIVRGFAPSDGDKIRVDAFTGTIPATIEAFFTTANLRVEKGHIARPNYDSQRDDESIENTAIYSGDTLLMVLEDFTDDLTLDMFDLPNADTNNAPTFAQDSYSATIVETAGTGSASIGRVLVAVQASDADAGDTLTYSITAGNDARLFAINEDGEITLAVPDVRTNPATHTLMVTATDGVGNSDTATVTITDSSIRGTDDEESMTGGNEQDFIYGYGGDDVLYGGDGDDYLSGGDDDDTLYGGEGNDYVGGGRGDDILYGADGNDRISGYYGDDTLYGGDGDDVLYGGHDDDTLYGGAGDDRLDGGYDRDTLYGGAGNDYLYGNYGYDILIGGVGNNILRGGRDVDIFVLNTDASGVDTVVDFYGIDYGGWWVGTSRIRVYVDDATETDTLEELYAAANIREEQGHIQVEGQNSSYDDETKTNTAIYKIVGEADSAENGKTDDVLIMVLEDVYRPLTRDDFEVVEGKYLDGIPNQAPTFAQDSYTATIAQGAEVGDIITNIAATDADSDTLIYAITAGNDAGLFIVDATNGDIKLATPETRTGAGDHTLTITATDTAGNTDTATVTITDYAMRGTDGEDSMTGSDETDFIYGYGGDDILNGGAGEDWIDGYDGDDMLYGGDDADAIWGGGGADTLYGGAGDDWLFGEGDDDRLYGGDGGDVLYGNEGDDRLSGDAGGDWLYGQDGDDRLYGNDGDDWIAGHSGDDTLSGGAGDDTLRGDSGGDDLHGGAGDDVLYGSGGDDTLYGGAGDDTLHGGSASDVLYGDAGADTLNGSYGGDVIYGGVDNDILNGDDGDDLLEGSAGTDTLYGGAGSDYLRGDSLAVIGTEIFTGPADADIFVLNTADSGTDTITDFTPSDGDKIRIEEFTGAIPATVGAFLTAANLRVEKGHIKVDAWANINIPTDDSAITNTAIYSGDRLVMVLEDFTADLTLDMFDLPNATPNTAPVFTQTSYTATLAETAAIGSAVIAMQAADVDAGDTLTYSITGGDGLFAINNDGEITLTGALDFETATSHTLTVQVEDSAGATDTTEVTINVTNTIFRGWDGSDAVDLRFRDDYKWDTIYGLGGDDRLLGGTRADTIYGGAGDDEIGGYGGDDRLYGGEGDDYIRGWAGDDKIYGGAGDDRLYGQTGRDLLKGGAGKDLFIVSAYPETNTAADSDVIVDLSIAEGERLELLVKPDDQGVFRISSFEDFETAHGVRFDTSGNKIIEGHESGENDADINDTVIYRGDVIVAVIEDAHITFDMIDWEVIGGADADTLYGGEGDDLVLSMGGNDALYGLGGDDILSGGDGDDFLDGGSGQNVLMGKDGADTFVLNLDGSSTTTISDFGRGNDKISLVIDELTISALNRLFSNDLRVERAHTSMEGFVDPYDRDSIENTIIYKVVGEADSTTNGESDDVLLVVLQDFDDALTYQMFGLSAGGDIVLTATNQAPTFTQNSYTATIARGAEIGDIITNIAATDADDDTLTYSITAGNDSGLFIVDATNGDIKLAVPDTRTDAGDHTLTITATDTAGNTDTATVTITDGAIRGTDGDDKDATRIRGTDGADVIYGYGGDDKISGGAGGDNIFYGGAGDDNLWSWAGNDILYGGAGSDILTGNLGIDLLYGGAGGDVFSGNISIYAINNIVVDFSADEGDRIELQLNAEGTFQASSLEELATAAGLRFDTSGNKIIEGHETGENDANINDMVIYRVETGNIAFVLEDFTDLTIDMIDLSILGADGDDTFYGGNGDDRLNGGDGDDRLDGGSGDDRLHGLGGDDRLDGGSGDDFVTGFKGDDVLDGGSGDDELQGGGGDDRLDGGDGDDVLSGDYGNDTLYGGAGFDTIYGFFGEDTLHGGDGTDYLIGGDDADIFVLNTGDSGFDAVADFTPGGGDKIRVEEFDGVIPGTIEAFLAAANLRVEKVYISDGVFVADDSLGIHTAIYASADSATNGESGDRLVMVLEDFTDDLTLDMFDLPNATANNAPVFTQDSYTADSYRVEGWTVRLDASGTAVVVSATDADGDAVTYAITAGNDAGFFDIGATNGTISFGAPDVQIHAATHTLTVTATDTAGNTDTATVTITDGAMRGTDNEETLTGSDDSDRIYGYDGDDTLYGGGGDDHIWDNAGDDTLYGGAGDDWLGGGDGDDTLYGVTGNNGLYGHGGDDTLYAGDGGDGLSGGDGDDTLYGSTGGDHLNGGAGDDWLEGGAGKDYLHGGGGADIFMLGSGEDRLGDFTPSDGDKIRVTDFTGTIPGSVEAFLTAANLRVEKGHIGVKGFNTSSDSTITENTAIYRGDTLLMVLEDFTDDLTLDMFDLPNATANNAPTFTQESYRMLVPHLASFGRTIINVAATDDDGDALTYSLTGGEGVFEIDETNGDIKLAVLDTVTNIATYKLTVTATDAAGNSNTAPVTIFNLTTRGTNDGETITGSNIYNINKINSYGGDDTLYGSDGRDVLDGGSGDDTLYGGAGDDWVFGRDGDDMLYGGDGDDIIEGFDGDDTLYGGDGDDKLYGNEGDDTLDSGSGDDYLWGGEYADIFVLGSGSDTVSDFTPSEGDKIRVDDFTGAMPGSVEAFLTAANLRVEKGHIKVEGFNSGRDSTTTENTAIYRGDTLLMVLEDFTDDLTLDMFDLPNATANNAPTFAQDSYSATLAETAEAGSAVVAVQASDVDAGNTLTYSITDGDGLFAINEDGEITLTGALDYETATTHTFTIQVEDEAGLTDTAEVTINVENANEAPIFSQDSYILELRENVGVLFVNSPWALDVDAGDVLTYSIIDGNEDGQFAIHTYALPTINEDFDVVLSDNTITLPLDTLDFDNIRGYGIALTSTLDYETATSHTFTIQVEDEAGLTDTAEVTINVENANEAPEFAQESYTAHIQFRDDVVQFGASGTAVVVSATDADGDALTYAITAGNDAGLFDIDGEGNITFGAPDVRTNPATHTLTVTATDTAGNFDTATVTITDGAIRGTDGGEAITGGESNDLIYSNDGDDILHGNDGIDTLDGGAGDDTLYGGSGRDWLYGREGDDILHGNDGNDVLLGEVGDDMLYGGSGDDLVMGYNGDDTLYGGAGADRLVGMHGADIFVLGSDVDRVIDFTPSEGDKIRVAEFTGVMPGSVEAFLTAANLRVEKGHINVPSNGFDRDNDDADIENTAIYSGDTLLMVLEDFTDDLTLDMFDLPNATPNSAPEFAQDSYTATLAETAESGSAVVTVQATDANAGDTLTYSIVSNNIPGLFVEDTIIDNAPPFAIDANSGAITLTGALDFETATTHTFTVQVEDSAGLTDTATITINVTDSAIRGTDDADRIGGTADADTIYGYGGDDFIYAQFGDDTLYGGAGDDVLHGSGGSDTLYGGAGDDTLDGGAGLDTLYGGDGDDEFALDIHGLLQGHITDDSHADTIKDFGNGNDKIHIHVPASVLPSLDVTISSLEQLYSIFNLRVEKGHIAVDGLAGNIDDTAIENTAIYSGDVLLMVLEDFTADLTLNMFAMSHGIINRAPEFAQETYTATLAEDAEAGSAVATITANDADAGDDLTYSISGGDGLFAINDDGEITLTGALDYETATSHNLTIKAQDKNGDTDTAKVVVHVTDANDNAPIFDAATHKVEIPELTEIGTTLTTVTARDADTSGVRYSIIGGRNANLFSINENTGAITLKGFLDFETAESHRLVVQASDGVSTDTINVIIGVVDEMDCACLDIAANTDEITAGTVLTASITHDDPNGYEGGKAPESGWVWFYQSKPDQEIGDGTSTYTVREEDSGEQICVRITYMDGNGRPEIVQARLEETVQRVVIKPDAEDADKDKTYTAEADKATKVEAGTGADHVRDGMRNDVIDGGKGDDEIDLSASKEDNDVVIYGIGNQMASDGADSITSFVRGRDKFVFQLKQSDIDAGNIDLSQDDGYEGFINYVTKGTEDLIDDQFWVNFNFSIGENGVQMDGISFHFKDSTFFSGGRISMPIVSIEFADPLSVDEVREVYSGRDKSTPLVKQGLLSDFDYLDDFLGGDGAVGFEIV